MTHPSNFPDRRRRSGPVSALIGLVAREIRIRRDLNRLEAMSDRDLADIGLNRGQLHRGQTQ